MSKVCSDRLYVRNELLSSEVNQSPRTVSQVKQMKKQVVFLPEVETVAQFNNDISFQVTEDGGEATCFTLQENCPMLSCNFSYCVFPSFLLLLSPTFSLHFPSQGPLCSQEASISGLQELCFSQVYLIKIHALSTSLAPIKQLCLLVVQSIWKCLRQTGFSSHLSLRSLCD